jgi:hypothetical protein
MTFMLKSSCEFTVCKTAERETDVGGDIAIHAKQLAHGWLRNSDCRLA